MRFSDRLVKAAWARCIARPIPGIAIAVADALAAAHAQRTASSIDSAQGKAVGAPFQVTQYDGPRHSLSTIVRAADIGISPHRLVLPITEETGDIWMLDNVDR